MKASTKCCWHASLIHSSERASGAGLRYYHARRFDESIATYRNMLDALEFPYGLVTLSWILRHTGDAADESVEVAEKAIELSGGGTFPASPPLVRPTPQPEDRQTRKPCWNVWPNSLFTVTSRRITFPSFTCTLANANALGPERIVSHIAACRAFLLTTNVEDRK